MDRTLIPFTINLTNSFKANSKIIYDNYLKHKNFTRIFEILTKFNYQAENNDSNLKEIIKSLKEESFNIKGTIIDIIQVMSSLHNDDFETEIQIKSNNMIFIIVFKKISKEFAEDINKLPKNVEMFFMNFRALLSHNNMKGDNTYILKFIHSKNSKIYNLQSSLNDEDCRLKFNNEITHRYEDIQVKQEEQKRNEHKRIITNAKIGDSIHMGHNASSSSNAIITSDLMNLHDGKEEENRIIFTNKHLINEIESLTMETKDFGQLLTRNVSMLIYPVQNIYDTIKGINKPTKVTVCGIVIGFKIDTKVTAVDILSLTDSNTIKIIHYPNTWKFTPVIRQVLLINKIYLKINKNFEFILENPAEGSIQNLGEITEEELSEYKKFRPSHNMQFSSIISLLKPCINRSILKYLLILKDISKVTARIETDYPSNSFEECPMLKLFAKCVVDDGTFEAQLNIYDIDVAKILKLTSEDLSQINQIAKKCSNCVLYQRSSETLGYISKEAVLNNLKKQFIVYCVPFSKIASKHFNENRIDKYLNNLGQENHLYKNKAMNFTYINGDIFYEKSSKGDFELVSKPILKVIHLDEVSGEEWFLN